MQRGFGFQNRRNAAFNPATLFAGGTVQGAWYDPSDLTTLFQDAAGTTPVTAVEQPVGAMLDKRAAGYSVFLDGNGDELSAGSSTAFAFGTGAYTVEFWVYLTAAVGAGHQPCFVQNNTTGGFLLWNQFGGDGLNIGTRGSGTNVLGSSTTLAASQWNHVVAVRSGTGAGQTSIFVNGTRVANGTDATNWTVQGPLQVGGITTANYYVTGYMSNVRVVKGVAVYDPTQSTLTVPTAPLSPIAGTSLLTCGTTWSGNPAITANGDARGAGLNPFTASPVGNHAYQTTSASRPTLRARYNLLTYSEQFDNAVWARVGIAAFGSGSVANTTATLDPLGGNTADFLLPTGGIANRQRVNQTTTVSSGVQMRQFCYIKPFGYTKVALRENNTSGYYVSFDLSSTSSPSILASSNATGTVVHVGNGWFLCTMTTSISGTSFGAGVYVLSPGYTTGDPETPTWTPNGTDGIFVWGAQLTAPSVFPSNVYQRIGASTDYATGAAFPPYLFFDGIDDSMLTNSVDFTGTDKMLVVAGVTKNSDATGGLIAELGNADVGGWYLYPGNYINAQGSLFTFLGRGTAVQNPNQAVQASTYAAPITAVLAATGNIAAPLNTLRVNTVAGTNATGNQGTGNYGNYPLFIGRRNNASLPFNGNIYSLVIAGAAYSAGQISSTESWVAAKTPLGTI